MKQLLPALLLLLAVYSGFVLLVALRQSRLLFFPEPRLTATPAEIGLDYEPISLKTADRVRLAAWFLPVAAARGVILFCHGNAGNISHRLQSLAIFHRLGYAVLIFDYRGYGESGGRPSEKGLLLDAEAGWQHLVDRGYRPGDIVLFGRSLGAAVAARLAVERRPRALIVESAFTSVPDLAAELYPWLPVRLFCRYRFDTETALAEVDCPLLVVHSRDDEIIPFAHAERLLKAGRGPRQLLAIRGDHNYGFLLSGRQYEEGLRSFLAQPAAADTPAR